MPGKHKQKVSERRKSDFESADTAQESLPEKERVSYGRRFSNSRGSRWYVAALACLAGLAALALAGPLLAPDDPTAAALGGRLAVPGGAHPLGTDHLGRDVLSRLLAASRLSLGVAGAAVVFSGLVGVGLGVISGRAGGIVSAAINRTVDTLIALPAILVGLTLVAIFDPGVITLFGAIVLVGWMPFARLAHALTLKLGSREYVEAAKVIGAREPRIILRHILPNAAGPLLSLTCLQFAYTLLTISGLSFLGLGAQPPTPEWGVMLSEGQPYLAERPALVLAPAAAIVAAALSVTAAGRALAKRWELPGG